MKNKFCIVRLLHIILNFIFLVPLLFGQAGAIDSSIGNNGAVVTNVRPLSDQGICIRNLKDGKILISGNTHDHTSISLSSIALTKLLSNGQLDPTFGNGGRITDNIGFNCNVHDMEILSDEKVLITGTHKNSGGAEEIFMARFLSNGSRDLTFGTNGFVITKIGFQSAAYGSCIQPDGKIVITGYVETDNSVVNKLAILRFDTFGRIDSTFGNNGLALPGISDTHGVAVDISQNGTIIVSSATFKIIRLLPSGQLDLSFGDRGILSTIQMNLSQCNTMHVQSDGKIMLAGSAYINDYHGVVIRLHSNGLFDQSFDNDGILIFDIGSKSEFISSTFTQSDNKIVIVGGQVIDALKQEAFIARINENGMFDTSFNNNGIKFINLNATSHKLNSCVVLQSGLVLACGSILSQEHIMLIIAIDSSGSYISGFNAHGVLSIGIGYSEDLPHCIRIQDDGKVLISGSVRSSVSSPKKMAICRYNPDGQLDHSFNNLGKQFEDNDFIGSDAYSMVLSTDKKILVASEGFNSDIYIWRFLNNGTPDSSFGTAGYINTKIKRGSINSGYGSRSLNIQKDGKILIVGYKRLSVSNTDWIVLRYLDNGLIDSTFGINGMSLIAVSPLVDEAFSVDLHDDGNIIIAGTAEVSAGKHAYAVAKLNSKGVLDLGFGLRGIVVMPLSIGQSRDKIASAKVLKNGKIILGGTSLYGKSFDYQNEFILIQFLENGKIDSTFGSGGISNFRFIKNRSHFCSDIYVQSDGKIISVGGTNTEGFELINSSGIFAIVRHNPDGSIDSTFGDNGKLQWNYIPKAEFLRCLDVNRTGQIYTTGNSFNGLDNDFVFYRLSSCPNVYNFNLIGCDSVLFNGNTYYKDQLIIDSLMDTNGCDIINKTQIKIHSSPIVTVDFIKKEYCFNDSPSILHGGNPLGGTYLGKGVINNYFYPDSAGVGIHIIEYHYVDSNGCASFDFDTVHVRLCSSNIAAYQRNDYIIFPNPSFDEIQILGEHPIEWVKVYNSFGQLMLYQIVNYELNELALNPNSIYHYKGLLMVEIKNKTGIFKAKVYRN